MAGKCGVVPQQLEDAALERELRCLYGTPYRDVLPWVAAGAAEAHQAYPPARAGVRQPLPDRTRTDSLPARKGLPGRGGPAARAVTRDQDHRGDGHTDGTPCRRQPAGVAL
jgi:hypothetical protein